MTDTAVSVLTDDELITLAGQLAAELKPDSGYRDGPILGTDWDQVSPDGMQNPYWEIVRRMPTYKDWHGAGREPDGFWCGEPYTVTRRAHDAGLDRSSLCARYAWSIPSPGDIAWITGLLDGRGVVEIGAGSGYWAWQLAQAGVDVIAYDPHPPGGDNHFVKHKRYHRVITGDHRDAAWHGDRALLLCWPSYCADFAALALKTYPGDLLVFIGEGAGGCTADDEFFALLEAAWDVVGVSPAHVTYWGIHCSVTAYTRRADVGNSKANIAGVSEPGAGPTEGVWGAAPGREPSC